jgi:preprotein translocase subunit SecD
MDDTASMTKTERADIQRLISNTAKLAKAHAKERSAHLRAEFERQIATTYSYSQDEVWKEAAEAAQAAVQAAAETVEQRCEELGIPRSRFAHPSRSAGAVGARTPSRRDRSSCAGWRARESPRSRQRQ